MQGSEASSITLIRKENAFTAAFDGYTVSARGRISKSIQDAFDAAH